MRHPTLNTPRTAPATATRVRTGLLAQLQGLAPTRKLQHAEALRVAELQAARLRLYLGADDYALDLNLLTISMSEVVVAEAALPVSGLSVHDGVCWQIRLNRTDPPTRQRFTLAHELKHIIDHPAKHWLPDGSAERLADYFAACLLAPKRLVVRLWGQGIQDTDQLAEQFEISPAAMTVRLAHLGLRRRARCQSVDPAISPSFATATAPGSETWT